jgi:hypothetical protein
MTRRQFLAAMGLGSLAVPAIASPPRTLTLHFGGSGGKQTLRVHPSSTAGRISATAIRVDTTAMRDFMALIDRPPSDTDDHIEPLARMLYGQIWGPIRKLPLSYRAVHIRAEDDFAQFAFEALRGERQWVGRAAAVHYLTKESPPAPAFRLSFIPDRASYSYCPFPEREDGILWAAREGRRVAKLTRAELREGSQATKSQLLADIGRPFEILHIATHGLVIDGHPDSACIALHRAASASHREGWFDPLRPNDLNSVHIDGRLVVLSACAPDPAAAQALSTRLIKRGTGEVISSRFATLDDAAAFTFMRRFYQELKTGANSSTALLRARSVMIDGSYPVYRHPYFWAAFRSFV